MTKYNVVAISEDGMIVGVEEYDPANDVKRDERRQLAANIIADRLNIPHVTLGKRAIVDDNGNEWGLMTGELEVGMVEIGIGKWGFEK